jgi:hypothetical protein
MPQGISAGRSTGYQARPGTRPTQRRLAEYLSTHKRASERAPSAVRPFQPAGTAPLELQQHRKQLV